MIKIIPFIGSLIDANTVGALKDRVMERRLVKLEEMVDKVLVIDDGSNFENQITKINSVLLTLIAQYQENFSTDNHELGDLLNRSLVVPKNFSGDWNPNPSFCFVIISGASATGKDVILDLLFNDFFSKHPRCEVLSKFTTRKKRAMDSRYYQFITRKQFQKYLKSGRIIFHYTKRGEEYGFDRIHLFNASKTNQLLFCIFTEFELLQSAKQFLEEQGINVKLILLDAPIDHLIHRSWHRILPEEEIKRRIRSIKRDISYITEKKRAIEQTYDFIIYTGDDRAKLDAYQELKSIVSKF